jgi:glycosyltransferase involved in cell wall biosynthesis
MNSGNRLHVAWLTNAPSGDMIDLLTAFASRPEINLNVIYCSPHALKGQIDCQAPGGQGRALKGFRLPGPNGGLFINPSIASVLARSSYDVLVIGGYAHPTMQLAMLVRSLQNKPWVLFAERPGMNKTVYWRNWARKLVMYMTRSANGVIATGRLAQKAFSSQTRPPDELFSLPYVIDHHEFLKITRRRNRTGTVSFMACGDLIHRKGIDVLIKAFRLASESVPRIKLTIVGDGSERETLAESIQDQWRELITFSGAVSFSERVTAFAEADVFIHPSRHDGWGVVIQEAMAAGLPVIATRETGAAYDLVEDGKNGFLVDAEDAIGLAQRISWFARHREQIEDFGNRARASVMGLTPEWGAAELVRITQTVIENYRSAQR